MRYLLDTHALIWWWTNSPRLSETARSAIGDGNNQILVSAASMWEVATKVRLGKLAAFEDPVVQCAALMADNGFLSLAISDSHALKAGLLPGPHRDPFDRMIAAQALAEGIAVVTCDPGVAGFGCGVVW